MKTWDIPCPSEKHIAVRTTPSGERALRRGHPWLFETGIRKQNRSGRAGDLVVAYDGKNRFLAVGLYDPNSPIRMRALAFHSPVAINSGFFKTKLSEAADRRASIIERQTTGCRLVYGESDGFPGLVVDKYAESLVVKIYTVAWIPWLKDFVEALSAVAAPKQIILRLSRNSLGQKENIYGLKDGMEIFGPPLDGPVRFMENGLIFEADLIRGQKTGFFLDQRENRQRVRMLAKNKSVLNAFAYTGGFSLYAAKGGAKSVVSLDLSKPALAAAAVNFSLNRNLAGCPHELLQGDAFALLAEMKQNDRMFDMVVIDPPSFAKQNSETEKAAKAYSALTQLGLGVLRRGGTLVSASCSSRIKADEFFDLVHKAAHRANRPLKEIERTGHPADHPVKFKENAYLKCLFAVAP